MVTYREQFYCHITEWDSDSLPVAGQRVTFDVQPTTKPNGLPVAVNVQPVDTTKAAEVLATGLPAAPATEAK
jgi:hypothetical protein